MKKHLIAAAGTATLLGSMLAASAFAAAPNPNSLTELDLGTSYVENTITLGKQDIRTTIANVINVALGLLGIIAVCIILIGGFKWMISGGEEKKVTAARQWIFQGIVGLIIILCSWAIASFVLSQLKTATNQ